MEVLFKLFFLFAKLYPFSFGGGVVMIPSMMRELEAQGLATASEITNIVALASMSPGSIAINSALGVGFYIAGVPGAIACFLGIVIPTAILVVTAATFFFRIYKYPIVKDAFYGLRPIITGIILYAATSMAVSNGIMSKIPNYINFEYKSMIIIAIVFGLLVKTKVHPIFLIISSGLLGTVIF